MLLICILTLNTIQLFFQVAIAFGLFTQTRQTFVYDHTLLGHALSSVTSTM